MPHQATSTNVELEMYGHLTVDEYLALSKKEKLFYRLYRHPLLMFTFGSVYLVLFRNRITHKGMNRGW